MSTDTTPDRILMFGAEWCRDCRRSKALLDREGVAYDYVDLDLRSGAWEAHHPCAPDSYLVETRVLSPTSFEERWTVRGPAKSYDALTTYERLPG